MSTRNKRKVKAAARKAPVILFALSLIIQMSTLPVAAYAEEAGSTAEIMLNEADDQTESGTEGQTGKIVPTGETSEPPLEDEESEKFKNEGEESQDSINELSQPQPEQSREGAEEGAEEARPVTEETAPPEEARKIPLFGEAQGTILAEKVSASEVREGDRIVLVYEPLGTALSLTPARTSRLAGCEVTMGETATRNVLTDAEDDLAILEVIAAESGVSQGDFYLKSEKGYLTASTTENGVYYASEPEAGSLCRFVDDMYLYFPEIESPTGQNTSDQSPSGQNTSDPNPTGQNANHDCYLQYFSGGPYFSSFTKDSGADSTPYKLALYRTNDIDPSGQLVGGNYILPLFETSDTHGHLADISGTPYKYLLAFISDKVKDVRGHGDGARSDLAILLDGGDIYQGNTLSNLMHGQPIAAAYQIMGYDAVTIGNHDFDWGLETAVDADKTMMDYEIGGVAGENLVPVVSANIYRNGAKTELADDYIILNKTAVSEEGDEIPVKVAVIGFAGNYGTSIKYERFAGAGYSISLDYDKVNAIAASLEESGQCDATILLAHEEAGRIAEKLGQDTAIDLVLGGHTHYNSNAATEWNLRYMQPASNGGAYVYAKMAFKVVDDKPVFEKVQSGRIINVKADPSKLTNDPQNAEELDPELIDLTDRVIGQLRGILEKEIGYITEPVLHLKYIEESGKRATTAGNWMTSIYRRIAGADVAFINGGGLRADFDIPEGQDRRTITLADIYTMLPFGNPVYCYEITYEELLRALQYALSNQGKILLSQISGIDCYYTGTTVNAIVVGGEKSGLRTTGETSGEETSSGETIYANGKWKEGWKDQKLRVAMNEYTATTNRVSSDGQTNPFYEWRGTDKLIRCDQVENEEAAIVLTAEAAANDGFLFVDTAPHFIEKEHEDIPETEEQVEPGQDDSQEPQVPQGEDPKPGEADPDGSEQEGPKADDPDSEKSEPEGTHPGKLEPGKQDSDDPGKPGSNEPGNPEKPSEQVTEKTETTEESSDGASTTSPRAGDSAETGLWVVLIVLSLLGLGRVCRR